MARRKAWQPDECIFSNSESLCRDRLNMPTAVFSSSDREHQELSALSNEMAARIAKAHEWQALNALAIYTGDGATEAFALPADYDRMLKKAQVWSSSLSTPLTPIFDRDKWLGLEVQAFDLIINSWIIYGAQIHIKPALGDGVTGKHWYQSTHVALDDGGAPMCWPSSRMAMACCSKTGMKRQPSSSAF